MAEKKEILDYLSQLDDRTLERVYNHARTAKMLYPETDLLLNANMAQMLEKADDLARVHLPQWTDRADGDFGQFLIELVALFSEKDFWYNNAFHLESNISTARQFSNVFTLAHQRGYDASVLTAPKLGFSITFSPLAELGDPEYKELLPGQLVVKERGGPTEYTNVETLRIPDSLTELTANFELRKGRYRTTSQEFNGASVFLDRPNIDPNSVRVSIDDVDWRKVNQFGLSSSEDKVFMVIPDEESRAVIYFGDGTYGRKPELGTTITAGYLVTDGVDVTAIGDFEIRDAPALRPAITAQPNRNSTEGGRRLEPIESIKQKAILYGRSRDTIINTDDCIRYLLSKPEIRRAYALFTNTQITLFALGRDGQPAGEELMSATVLEVRERMVQLGFTVGYTTPLFVRLPDMDIKVQVLPNSDFNAVKRAVQQAAKDFYDPLVMGDFGRPFVFDDFYIHLSKSHPAILRLRIDYSGTTDELPDTLPLLPQEIIQAPVVDSGNGQNVFVAVTSI